MIVGWDGASYQGRPNVANLKEEGHVFVIEKVTGEGSYVNPFWSGVRDDARAAGVLFGSYDWTECQNWANEADARFAASEYLGVVGARQTGELLAVDFETPQWLNGPLGRDIEAAMKAYLYTLRDNSGQPVIVYTGQYFLQETGADKWDWLGRDFILWLAAPGPVAMLPDDAPWPAAPAPWSDVALHQHQWHATSTAVVGEFDRNRFRGTIEELRAMGKPADEQPQMPPAAPSASDPGFPGIVQADRSLAINGVVVPNGYADRTERLLIQVLNQKTGKQYWVEWQRHQWLPWHEGGIPL